MNGPVRCLFKRRNAARLAPRYLAPSRSPSRFPPSVSRIVQTGDTPAKRRTAHERAAASALERLARKADLADAEARDLAAFLAFHLRGLFDTLDESAHAWDERGYFRKAEALRHEYRWARRAADLLEDALATQRFDALAAPLADVVPRLASVQVPAKDAVDEDRYVGAFRALLKRRAQEAA